MCLHGIWTRGNGDGVRDDLGCMAGIWNLRFFAGGFNALAKAIISDTAPHDLKATAYGVYYTAIGVATLTSLAIGGWLWDRFGS